MLTSENDLEFGEKMIRTATFEYQVNQVTLDSYVLDASQQYSAIRLLSLRHVDENISLRCRYHTDFRRYVLSLHARRPTSATSSQCPYDK